MKSEWRNARLLARKAIKNINKSRYEREEGCVVEVSSHAGAYKMVYVAKPESLPTRFDTATNKQRQ